LDGTMVVLTTGCQTQTTPSFAFAYDMARKIKYPDIPIVGTYSNGKGLGATVISPRGDYLRIDYEDDHSVIFQIGLVNGVPTILNGGAPVLQTAPGEISHYDMT